jgi:predicted site-specific integrase-resolvase
MYVKPKIACQELGVSPQTLKSWAKNGRIKFIYGGNGGILYDVKSITEPNGNAKKKYIYCRVSTSRQKDDLTRQIEYLRGRYPEHEVVFDIASGVNFKRKALQGLLDGAINGNIEEIVVAHKDRICRFAFDHFKWLFERLGVNFVVESRDEHSPEAELADDLFSIIHVFSCRHYGQRRGYTIEGIRSNCLKKDE